MGKLAILFYVFVGVTLGVFGAMVYLMMHVNPPHHDEHTTHHDNFDHGDTTVKETTTHETSKHALALMEVVMMPPISTSRTCKEDDDTVEEDSSKETNITDPKKPKGRRSINQRRKKEPGVVIMKVVDDEGRPRIEILLYPKRSNKRKMHKKNDVLGSKRRETNAVLNIMPDDTIVLEKKVVSNEQNLKTEIKKDIFDIGSSESILNHDKSDTKLRISNPVKLLSTQNMSSAETSHVKVNSTTKINTSEEVTTELNKGIVVQNDSLLRSTIPNLNIVSRNNSYIETDQTETSKDLSSNIVLESLLEAFNNHESLTKYNTTTVLPITENTSSIETSFVNVESYSSEKIHTKSYEDIIVQNTDDLLNSTTSFNADNGYSTSVWISEEESSENVSNKDDLRSKIETLNYNDSVTKKNYDSQSTSTEANFNIEMTINSVEVPTQSYKEVLDNNTDTKGSIWIISSEKYSQEETIHVSSNYSTTYEYRTEKPSTTLTNKDSIDAAHEAETTAYRR